MTRTLREIRKAAVGERRVLTVPASALRVEIRTDDSGDEAGVLTLSGHAAVFDVVSDLGYFTETVKRGFFRKALSENQDTIFNWDHQSRWPLARVSAGNLRLSEDTTGLLTESEIPLELSYAKDLKVLLDLRIIQGMSFAFSVLTDEWTEGTRDGTYYVHRDLIECDTLYDVCVTVIPATPETDAEGRAAECRTLEIDDETIERIEAICLEAKNEATPEGDESELRSDATADAEPRDGAVDDADVTGDEIDLVAASRRARIRLLELK